MTAGEGTVLGAQFFGTKGVFGRMPAQRLDGHLRPHAADVSLWLSERAKAVRLVVAAGLVARRQCPTDQQDTERDKDAPQRGTHKDRCAHAQQRGSGHGDPRRVDPVTAHDPGQQTRRSRQQRLAV